MKLYPNCGTYAGYRKHHNHNTKPCIECLAANNIYSKIRYQKNGKLRQANSRARNIEKVRERERAKSRKRRANITIPYNELQVISKYGGNCYICGLEIDFMASRKCGEEGWENGLHIDHLIPIAKGGIDSLDNVRPTHGICNLSKWANIVY
jgi:5-methylcytosine-specific restriction endonuclease McrA